MPAPKGNKYAQVYTFEEAFEKFKEMLEYSATDDCLCVQDAFLHVKMPSSTFYYLTESYKELEDIKKDIDANVISKINRKALKGEFQPTASIWRMKQLGEKDKTEVENKNYNHEIKPITKEELKELDDETEDYC